MPKSGAMTVSAVLTGAGSLHQTDRPPVGPFRLPLREVSGDQFQQGGAVVPQGGKPGGERFVEGADQVGRRQLFHHRPAQIHGGPGGGKAAGSSVPTRGSSPSGDRPSGTC